MKPIRAESGRSGSRAVPAILVGGLAAGALDLIAAFILYGWNVPHSIASGLIGSEAARSGGVPTWILGVVLHFFIACVAAAVYWAASRRLTFLREYAFVCGLFFGIAVYLVMQLIVLPLSALHATGPYTYRGLVQGLLIHMFIVGLPISYSVKLFDVKRGVL
jgi:hypothetical protein